MSLYWGYWGSRASSADIAPACFYDSPENINQTLSLERTLNGFSSHSRGAWGEGYSVGCILHPHHQMQLNLTHWTVKCSCCSQANMTESVSLSAFVPPKEEVKMLNYFVSNSVWYCTVQYMTSRKSNRIFRAAGGDHIRSSWKNK